MRLLAIITTSLLVNLVGWSLFARWILVKPGGSRPTPVEITLSPPARVPVPRPPLIPPPLVVPLEAPLAPARFQAPPGRPPRALAKTAPRTPEPSVASRPQAKAETPALPANAAGALPRASESTPVHSAAAPAPAPTKVRHRPTPARPRARGIDLAGLRTRIFAAIRKHRHYPRLARRRGVEGTVVLAFRLSRSGALASVRVERSAGRLLDQAAVSALRKATPLPYYPDWVRVPVRFLLED